MWCPTHGYFLGMIKTKITALSPEVIRIPVPPYARTLLPAKAAYVAFLLASV
jgi:hypothetical protein